METEEKLILLVVATMFVSGALKTVGIVVWPWLLIWSPAIILLALLYLGLCYALYKIISAGLRGPKQ